MLHLRFHCRWCGRKISGCPDTCQEQHKLEEVEACAFCQHRPDEEKQQIESYPDDPEITQSLLGLVLENPPSLETVTGWTPGQRRAAEDWAGREHLAASDNDGVERVKCPTFIREEVEREVSHDSR